MSNAPIYPWCSTGVTPHPAVITAFWCTHVVWLCNIILGVFGMYKIIQLKDGYSKALFTLFIVIAVLFIISPPGFTFGLQSGWECWYNSFRPWQATNMLSLNGYLYGLAAIYLFFMLRLQKVFADTPLEVSKMTMLFLSFGLALQLITPMFATYYFLAGWNQYDRQMGMRYYIAFTYTNVISSLAVLAIFIRKILILSQLSGAVNKELLRVATRYLICCLFAMATSNIVGVLGIVRGQILTSDLAFRAIHHLLLMIDSSLNLFFLHLQFPWGDRVYDICCGKVDIWCQNRFLKLLHLQPKNEKELSGAKSTNINTTETTSGPSIALEVDIVYSH